MNGHISSRGPLGKPDATGRRRREGPPYFLVLEAENQKAQRCPACAKVDTQGNLRSKRYWLDDLHGRPLDECPVCHGPLEVITDRRQITRGLGPHGTKEDARKALAKVVASDEHYIAPTNLTLATYLRDHWLPNIERQVRPSTFSGYKHDCYAFIIPALGSKKLRQLTPLDVDGFYLALESTPAKGKNGQPLAPKTRRLTHITLRKALADAVRKGLVNRNAAADADPPALKRTTMLHWTPEQLGVFLAAAAADRLFPLWRTAAMTGLRRGEIAGLTWGRIDLDAATVSVAQSRVVVGKEVHLSEPKTDAGRRSVPLDPETVAALRTWRVKQKEELLTLGRKQTADTYAFTNRLLKKPRRLKENPQRRAVPGEPLDPGRITKLFDEAQAGLDIPRIRLHDLRHTHASILLQAGVHPKIVSERLGHANISITLDTYSHLIPAMSADAASLMAAIVAEASV